MARDIHTRILDVLGSHPEGISINDMREELQLDVSDHQHLDRRIRDLDDDYEIVRKRSGRHTLYTLKGKKLTPRVDPGVTKNQRARILWRAQERCEMCGRTISEDNIKLHVDHKIPQEWGGPSTDDNLWALCSYCNEGKKNFFSTITDNRIRQAMLNLSVHIRLGELLKAFGGEPVPAKYLELVAYTHDDWQKRLRELREIGWEYSFSKHLDQETRRTRVTFSLIKSQPWPTNPAAAIRAAEAAKGKRR